MVFLVSYYAMSPNILQIKLLEAQPIVAIDIFVVGSFHIMSCEIEAYM